jgi:hypothetical protein
LAPYGAQDSETVRAASGGLPRASAIRHAPKDGTGVGQRRPGLSIRLIAGQTPEAHTCTWPSARSTRGAPVVLATPAVLHSGGSVQTADQLRMRSAGSHVLYKINANAYLKLGCLLLPHAGRHLDPDGEAAPMRRGGRMHGALGTLSGLTSTSRALGGQRGKYERGTSGNDTVESSGACGPLAPRGACSNNARSSGTINVKGS